jgi:hypothetical protein
MTATSDELPPLAPLRVTCGTSNCTSGLHSYKPPKGAKDVSKCSCKDCGASPVDWGRVRGRVLEDIEHTFSALQTEYIRHDFFNRPFDERALTRARKEGPEALYSTIKGRLEKSVGKAKQFRDGIQTPFVGKVVHYAQHATATCCRKCMRIWHGIEPGQQLTDEQTDYCVALISAYLKQREKEIFAE